MMYTCTFSPSSQRCQETYGNPVLSATLDSEQPIPLLMELDREKAETVQVTVTLNGTSTMLQVTGLDLFYDDSGKETAENRRAIKSYCVNKIFYCSQVECTILMNMLLIGPTRPPTGSPMGLPTFFVLFVCFSSATLAICCEENNRLG